MASKALAAWRVARAALEAATRAHAAGGMPGAAATPTEIDAWVGAHESLRIDRAHLAWLAAEIDEPVVGTGAAWRLLYVADVASHATVGLGAPAYARSEAQQAVLALRAIGYRARVVARGDAGSITTAFEVWL